MSQCEAFSGLFINNEGKVLLLKRTPGEATEADFWEVLSGETDQNLTPREVFQRESFSKLGVSPMDVSRLGVFSIQEGDQSGVSHAFLCKGFQGEIVLDPKKYNKYGWYSKEELGSLSLTPQVSALLRSSGIGINL